MTTKTNLNTPHLPARQRQAARTGRPLLLRRRAVRQQRGASLLEVMVVLIIILIGVFSVIQIFPIGFQGIAQAGNRSIATRLALQTVEQNKSDDANLPLGVLPTLPLLAGVAPSGDNLDPDNLAPYRSDNGTPDDPTDDTWSTVPYFQDVNKARRIEGEAVKVPLSTGVAGSVYTLKFGPVYMEPAVVEDETADLKDFLNIYGAPFRGVAVEAETVNPGAARGLLRGPNTYLVDYGEQNEDAYFLFPPSGRPLTYRLSFTYLDNSSDTNPKTVPVDTFNVTVPAIQSGTWMTIPRPAGGNFRDIVPGSEKVSRVFRRIPRADTFDPNDPYEYKLLSSNVPKSAAAPASEKVYANVGVIAFNPTGANYAERTAFGQQPFTAFMDYAVLDWHILHEDREVPATFFSGGDSISLKLTLGNIKRYGFSQEIRVGLPNEAGPGEVRLRTYSGLYGVYAGVADPAQPPDIQVFNLQNGVAASAGAPLLRGDYANRANAPDSEADYWVSTEARSGSYSTGTIYINPKRVPVGTQLRILYKASGDWAVAVQKAYAQYKQVGNPGDPLPTIFGAGQFARSPQDGEGTRLYFNRNDLNKSIVVTFDYIRNTGAAGEQDTAVRTAPIQLSINTPGVGAQSRLAYVDLADPRNRVMPQTLGDRNCAMIGLKNRASWRVFGSPTGVSLKVRVIYRDNGNRLPPFPGTGETSIAQAYGRQWRVQDIDTYITRAPGVE